MKRLFFRSNSLLEVIYSCFLQEEQIFKSSKRGRLRNPVAERSGDQMKGRSRNIRGTSVKHDF